MAGGRDRCRTPSHVGPRGGWLVRSRPMLVRRRCVAGPVGGRYPRPGGPDPVPRPSADHAALRPDAHGVRPDPALTVPPRAEATRRTDRQWPPSRSGEGRGGPEPIALVRRTILRRHMSPPGLVAPHEPARLRRPPASPTPRERPMTKIQETGDKVLANVERVIVGKHHEVRLALVALLCRGHLLIEDVPGTGKTVLAKAIARSLGSSFRRIQFTPDLLPSDVSGLSIYNQKTQEFEFRPGPIFSQIVLADEINRATPKTQSALLECMEERQATIDGTTYPMPDPFLVIATQNPIEYEGTFALPEAQLDRFMLRLRLGYPQPIEEIVILDEQKRTHPLEDLEEVLTVEELREMQEAVREIYVDSSVADYIVRLVGTDPQPPRRLPRRLAARFDRPVPGRPGAGGSPRPGLRHPRRHQGARRTGPCPSADHQDEFVDPRRPGRPGRPGTARDDLDRGHPTDRAGRSDRTAQPGGRVSRPRRVGPGPSAGCSLGAEPHDPPARAAVRHCLPRRRRVLDRAGRSSSTCSTSRSSSSAARTSWCASA